MHRQIRTGRLRIAPAALAALLLVPGCDSRHRTGGLAAPSPEAVGRQLATLAARTNQAAPASIDADTRLDGAQAGPGLKFTTRYTLVNAAANGVDTTSFASRVAPLVRSGGCNNPELRPLIAQGVIVVLEYRGPDGALLGTVNLDRASCRSAAAAPSS